MGDGRPREKLPIAGHFISSLSSKINLSLRVPTMMVMSFFFTRAADQSFHVYIADTLLTIGACPVLFWKLRNTEDIFNMSTEIQRVGAVALLALGK